MGTAKSLYLKLKAVSVDQIARQSITDTADVYANLNAEQLAKGLSADGDDTKPSYAPITIAIKRSTGVGLGAVTDRVTLFDKGNFYRGIHTTVQGDRVVTTSTDRKTPDLEEKYGDIFGLSPRFKQEYLDEALRPEWKKEIQAATGLTLKR